MSITAPLQGSNIRMSESVLPASSSAARPGGDNPIVPPKDEVPPKDLEFSENSLGITSDPDNSIKVSTHKPPAEMETGTDAGRQTEPQAPEGATSEPSSQPGLPVVPAAATARQLDVMERLRACLREKPSEQEQERRLRAQDAQPKRYENHCAPNALHFVVEHRFTADHLDAVLSILDSNVNGVPPVLHVPWETTEGLCSLRSQGRESKRKANRALDAFLRLENHEHPRFHCQNTFERRVAGMDFGHLTGVRLLQLWHRVGQVTGRPGNVIVLNHDEELELECERVGAPCWTLLDLQDRLQGQPF